ncbi:hypothetical protein M885DRAFT_18337 [Pelagophyceae sp. CCMP2097]|nr:hypothetical protein M885DRAFT_18337 [Pelagophyceae sp. CCMP2097]
MSSDGFGFARNPRVGLDGSFDRPVFEWVWPWPEPDPGPSKTGLVARQTRDPLGAARIENPTRIHHPCSCGRSGNPLASHGSRCEPLPRRLPTRACPVPQRPGLPHRKDAVSCVSMPPTTITCLPSNATAAHLYLADSIAGPAANNIVAVSRISEVSRYPEEDDPPTTKTLPASNFTAAQPALLEAIAGPGEKVMVSRHKTSVEDKGEPEEPPMMSNR